MAGMNRPPGNGAVRVSLGSEHPPAPPVVVEVRGRVAADDPHGGEGHGRQVLVDGQAEPVHLVLVGAGRARLMPEGATVLLIPADDRADPAPGVTRREVVLDGWRFVVDLEPEARARLRERATKRGDRAALDGPTDVRAMIPGRILSIGVAAGDLVEAGQAVMIIEAMKMQNELRTPRAGTVRRLAVAPGETVELGDLLLVVEASASVGPE
jgi:biotin carboxyl carrier protein